jgi:hypothetical protein
MIYALFAALTLYRDNFMSQSDQQQYATMSLLPKLNWEKWLTAFVIITLVAILEGAYSAHKKRTLTVRHTSPPTPLPQQTADLPATRPKLFPVRYVAKSRDHRYGLVIKNNGEPAFDVSIESVEIGKARLKFETDRPSLTMDDGDVLFVAWIEESPGSGLLGSGLRNVMIKKNASAIPVSVKYKDGDNRWYRTICNLERDFHYGIRAGFSRQELIAPPAPPESVSPLEIVFDPSNPARRFWSMESPKDEHGVRLPGAFWEHRVEIRNNSMKTLRNVSITIEHMGPMPIRPFDTVFDKIKNTSCDLKPGCSELAPVVRWHIPKKLEGYLAGSSAWGYGPIKITASADDTAPSVRTFQFNYETDQMLFDEVP